MTVIVRELGHVAFNVVAQRRADGGVLVFFVCLCGSGWVVVQGAGGCVGFGLCGVCVGVEGL